MNLNIDYQQAIDFEHCESLFDAQHRLSEITNILNKIIMIRQGVKKDILSECSKQKGEQMHKLSWENKMVRLSELTGSTELSDLWQESDSAYRQLKNKQDQVVEDINSLKKIIEVTPK
jgi:ABC-type uncharacterized transport system ATPase subunit